MSAFTIYSIPGSPYGRAVLAALEEKAVDYRFSAVMPGTFRQQPHVSRHPFGRVPVLDHDGFVLYETQAILRYLDRLLPGVSLTPADLRAAALMDQVLNVNDWYLMQGVNNVIGFQRIVGPKLLGLTPDETAIAAVMPQAHIVINELSRLLGGKLYLADEAVTLADLAVAAQLDFLSMTPEWAVLTEKTPNLLRWLQRMNARPSFVATTWEHVSAMAA